MVVAVVCTCCERGVVLFMANIGERCKRRREVRIFGGNGAHVQQRAPISLMHNIITLFHSSVMLGCGE
jgi:hypothetical protein